MKSFITKSIQKLRTYLKRLGGTFLTRLPETEAEMHFFIGSVLELGGLPDNDSFRHAIATSILHLDSSKNSVKKLDIIRQLRRSITNQVAFSLIADIKAREKAAKDV